MNAANANKGPLTGITVLDFGHWLAAPLAGSMLGDLGAEVIKIEPPSGDPIRQQGPPFQEGESAFFFSANRNKKSFTIDLKSPPGIRVVKRLVENCQVIIENFRPGVMERYSPLILIWVMAVPLAHQGVALRAKRNRQSTSFF